MFSGCKYGHGITIGILVSACSLQSNTACIIPIVMIGDVIVFGGTFDYRHQLVLVIMVIKVLLENRTQLSSRCSCISRL